MARPIYVHESADGRRFGSKAEALLHERRLHAAGASADPHDLLVDVLLEGPAVQRAVDAGKVDLDLVAELAGWLLLDPARTAVGEVLRMADEAVARSGRNAGKPDGQE